MGRDRVLQGRAKVMRKAMTLAELRLWERLRGRSLGVKFRRQVVLGNYIVDFACLERQLIVEVDGSQHHENAADAVRDEVLRSQGFTVLRFWNHDVLHNPSGVAEAIQAHVVPLEGDRREAPRGC